MHFMLQNVLDFDTAVKSHEFNYIEEAGFNIPVAKTKHWGRNVIGQKRNITLCNIISL